MRLPITQLLQLLPRWGALATMLVALLPGLSQAQAVIRYSYPNGTGTYTESFDGGSPNLSSTPGVLDSRVPDGWVFLETGTGANATYVVNDGSTPTGNTYSYGASGSSDRAFGTLRSNVLVPTIGASFFNNTEATITRVDISYSGEQWRLGATGRTDQLTFEYSLDATSLTTGTWLPQTSLNFVSPVTTGSTGGRDGNSSANRTTKSGTLTNLTIAPGNKLWIRWTDLAISGTNDGLAVDNFSLVATLKEPEIDVRQGSTSLASGTGSYAYGSTVVGATTNVTFTVANSVANAVLSLSGFPNVVALSGPDANQFSVTTQPSLSVIGVGTTTFVLRFAPTSAGAKSATVTIPNTDPDESPYTFTITGTGEAAVPPADIEVRQGSTALASNTGSYTFAPTTTGSSTSTTFTVANTGGSLLSLNGTPTVAISGADASQYSVTTQPATTVAAGGSTTFVVRFAPTSAGTKVAAISIANDDPDTGTNGESPYTFALSGEGVAPTPVFTATPGTLSYSIPVGTASTQTYALDGSNLPANAAVTISSNNAAVTFSLNNGATYASSGTATTSATGTLSQLVTVRFAAPATVGTTTAVISNTLGALSAPVSITGNATLAAPPSMAGQLLLEDNFAYAPGPLAGAGSWQVLGTAATPAIGVSAGSLAMPNYPVGALTTNNQATLGASGEDLYKSFGTAPAGSSALYVAALLSVSSAQATGDYFLHFADASNPAFVRGLVSVKASPNGYQLGLSASGATPTYTSTEYGFNTPYLVVLKCSLGAFAARNTYSLYVYNGAISQTEPSSPNLFAAETNGATGTLDAVALRQGTAASAPTLALDGLRVSTGWGTAIGRPSFAVAEVNATLNGGSYTSLATLSGNQTVTVSGAAVVEQSLVLDGGRIITSSTNTLTLRDRTTLRVDAGGASYVQGPLAFQTTDAPSLLFPLGKNGNYRPLTVAITAGRPTITTYTAEQLEGTPTDRTLLGAVRRVSGVRYFSVSADPPYPTTAPTGFRGVITLSFGPDDRVTDPAAPELVVAKNSGAGWESIDRSANTATTLTSGEFTSFSLFALGSIDPVVANNPLPVSLTRFTAERSAAGVRLAWATASEKNSARFEVQRSGDGKAFERIGTVAAQGTTASPTAYTFLDSTIPPTHQPSYYRLRQVDLDGTAAYSPVRVVTTAGQQRLTLYPNPAHGAATLSGATPGTLVQLFDALGRAVAHATADASGTARLALPGGLAAGVYIVRSGTQAQRLTVE